MTLTPKNWTTFQHYHDRRPPWIKLHKSLLDDVDYLCLPDASKALAPFIWLLASEFDGGEISLSLPKMAMRLRMSESSLMEGLKPLIDEGFFIASEALAKIEQNARLDREEKEKEKEKEKRENNPSPSAQDVSLVGKKKTKPTLKVKTTELKPESVAAFQEAWVFVPKTFRKWDQEARDYTEEPVSKGSRLIAERNFQRIVDAGVASPNDLCYALQAYVLEGEMPKKGFFQHVSTFYGPDKSTYLEWLDRSKQIQKEIYG